MLGTRKTGYQQEKSTLPRHAHDRGPKTRARSAYLEGLARSEVVVRKVGRGEGRTAALEEGHHRRQRLGVVQAAVGKIEVFDHVGLDCSKRHGDRVGLVHGGTPEKGNKIGVLSLMKLMVMRSSQPAPPHISCSLYCDTRIQKAPPFRACAGGGVTPAGNQQGFRDKNVRAPRYVLRSIVAHDGQHLPPVQQESQQTTHGYAFGPIVLPRKDRHTSGKKQRNRTGNIVRSKPSVRHGACS